MLTLFGYVSRNLGRQKLRTALSVFGVMLGVWLVVVFAALSAGILRTAEAMLTEFGEDFHCYRADVADQFTSTIPETATRERLRRFPDVEATASLLWWFAKVPPATGTMVLGLRPDEFAVARLLEGDARPFSAADAREVLVGQALLDRAGREVGEDLPINGTPWRIVGRYRTGKALYDNAVVVPLAAMQREFWQGADVANSIAVRVAPGADRGEVAARVEAAFPELSAVSTIEELSKVDTGLEKMQVMSAVIAVVATLLGVLFVLLSMLTSVFERVREVGILRAVGWTKRRIVLVVLLEALLFALAGVVLGIPTGMLGVELIGRITEIGSFVRPSYEPALFFRALLVAVLAAGAGGIYPAWRAARLHPVEAIRHE